MLLLYSEKQLARLDRRTFKEWPSDIGQDFSCNSWYVRSIVMNEMTFQLFQFRKPCDSLLSGALHQRL